MPAGIAIFLGVAITVIFFCAGQIVSAVTRSGVASDCKRDGFAWIDGVKYECKAFTK